MNCAFRSFAIAAGVLCCATACRKEANVVAVPSLDSNVVARVQGNAISAQSYGQKLRERLGRVGSPPSATDKEAVLDEMIRRESVYAQAKLAKFDEQPEVAALIKNLIVSRFIEQNIGKAESVVPQVEVENYYGNHSAEFILPAAVRAALIFLRASPKMAPEKREELRQQARLILAEVRQAKNEADFVHLVQRYSEDQATRYGGGDLGWLTRGQCEAALGPEAAVALFAMSEPNSLAPLMEAPDGFRILKLRERKEAQPRPLAEVEELIRYRLRREHQFQSEKEFYARMKQGLEIQINEPLLKTISIQPPEQNPPNLPGTAQRLAIQ